MFLCFSGCFFFVFRALARNFFGFIFRAQPSKTGNFLSASGCLLLAPSAGAAEPRPQPRQYRRRVGLRRVCGRILENMPWWWWWLDDMLPLPHTHAAASQRPPSRQSALARVFAARLCYRGPAGLPEHQPDRPRASGSAATPEKRDPGPKQSPRASAAVPLPSARAQQDSTPRIRINLPARSLPAGRSTNIIFLFFLL